MTIEYDPHADDDDEDDFIEDFGGAADDLLDRVDILREKAKHRGYDDPDLVVSQALRLLFADAVGDVVSLLEAQAEAQAETAALLQAAHEAANQEPRHKARPKRGGFRLVDDDE